jgi:membrane-bound ClpP family serine protease
MSTVLGLILAALVLIFFEVILPGGILGLMALVSGAVATWLAYLEFGMSGALITLFGTIVAAGLLIYVELKWVARTGLGREFFLKTSVTGHSNVSAAEDSIIGKSGKSLTRLNPSGKVVVDAKTYEAYSQDGYIESDQSIQVVSKDNFKLIIKKL